jgi:hypothetical protein
VDGGAWPESGISPKPPRAVVFGKTESILLDERDGLIDRLPLLPVEFATELQILSRSEDG